MIDKKNKIQRINCGEVVRPIKYLQLRILQKIRISGSLLTGDSLTHRSISSKTTILGLLQIRILHLRKRREKSFPTAKMFLVLKLCWFKVVICEFTPYGLSHFSRSTILSFIIAAKVRISGPAKVVPVGEIEF